jgi:hypothetical protein
LDIETSLWRSKMDNDKVDGVGVRLKCTKNALGVTHREIYTRMIWWEDVVGWRLWDPQVRRYSPTLVSEGLVIDGKQPLRVYEQRTKWDWDWSLIHLLLNLPAKYQRRLKEVGFDSPLKVEKPKGDVDCRVCCQAVGMKADEMLGWQEVGRKIHEDPVLMDRLRTALGIKRRAVMKGDYLNQLNAIAGELT